MKHTKIRSKFSTLFFIAFMVLLFGKFVTPVLADSKPYAVKKKVTMTKVGDSYTIILKNVNKKAKVTYKSSDKSVVDVKTGKVTAIGAGSAKVTVKIKQNKKTYKIKIKFTVKIPKSDKKTSENEIAGEKSDKNESPLLKRATRYDYYLSLGSNTTVYGDASEAEFGLLEMCRQYSEFSLYVKDLSLVSPESDYLDKYPTLRKLEFKAVEVYDNVCCIRISSKVIENLFTDEIGIDFAIAHHDASRLTQDEKKLYHKLLAIGENLKKKGEYDTVKAIHDYIVLNCIYPSDTRPEIVHRLEGAVNNGYCVCDGYSKEFYFLCRVCGIESMIVTGTGKNGERSELHAWNKVKIDGEWYGMDVTWDDPSPDKAGRVLYDYFLITDSDMAKEHFWDNSSLPKADSQKLGIIYEKYKDITRFSTDQEAYDLAYEKFEKVKNGGRCDLEFISSGKSDQLYNALVKLLVDYNRYYGCGYSISAEGAGFYGMFYNVSLYR